MAIIFLMFLGYSILGWLFEVICCSINEKRLASRGFLIGPYCPIYGVAGLIITYMLHPMFNSFITLFLVAAATSAILEYITGYILEKLFDTRWWDYSHYPLNIDGRIAMPVTLLFGLFALVGVYVINPALFKLLDMIPGYQINITATILSIVFILDVILSFIILFKIKNEIKSIKKDYSDRINAKVRNYIINSLRKLFP